MQKEKGGIFREGINRQAGIIVVFDTHRAKKNRPQWPYVINQSIPAGSIVDAGTIITLELSTKVP